MNDAPDLIVRVRRQWNDWREASYSIKDVSGFHWSDVSGGVNARANRAYLHAYVWCDGMVEGELAHSCRHGQGPHRIKVCIVKKANKATWKQIMDVASADLDRRTTS
jgi:hypothetical protein